MAFDAFRAQAAAPRARGRKSLWYALSIGFHGALIAAGVAYSFWHIEELSPPVLRVTFMSAAPPPAPAAPPPAGGGAAANVKPKKPTVKPKPIVEPKPEIVQPKEIPKKEEPKEEPKAEDPHGEKDGVKGGVAGGTPGGVAGGTPGGKIGGTPGGTGTSAASGPPKFLPPNIGMAQKVSGDDPPFPASLRKPGAVYHVLVKVCVNTSGGVDKVTIMRSTDSQLDGGVIETLRSNWRFRPYMANATPIPFCTIKDFEFKTL
ncbi:MAG TPA: energy transducer TonB [Polyangia bacterium]|jgi:protein TonB